MKTVELIAQAPTSNPSAPSGRPWYVETPIIPMLLVLAVMYFFVIRSKRTEERKRTDMLSQLKRGDRVQTIGGVLGTVVEARENEVVLKVDETSNTKIRFLRSAIHRVIEEETQQK